MTTSPWQVLRAEADTLHTPGELADAAGWLPAVVPGGVGSSPALVDADPDAAVTADEHAWWFRRAVETGEGPHELVLDGIGTYADVYVDGEHVARSDNAFRAQHLPLDVAPGEHVLAVRIGALTEVAVPRRPRARWRSALLPDASMRWRRSPHLGRIPSWQGAAPYVGIVGHLDLRPARARLGVVRATRVGDDGVVDVTLDGHLPGATVRAGEHVAVPDAQGRVRLVVPNAPAWRPHTHGEPATCELVVEQDGQAVDRRVIGFARIEILDPTGSPRVQVDGLDVFVRGACWVPTDARAWVDDPDRVERDLRALADAGMNAVRITGTNRYEPAAFWDAAARAGLLVWQDVMLATFDPPEDEAWLAELEVELTDQLSRLQGRPNVLAVCGGTETEQQPTLMGVDIDTLHISAIHDVLPRVAATVLPDAPHVTSSPSGGPLPTSIAQGFSHYFGVGAYLRPLDDALSSRVAFASESLAFAIPPEEATVRLDEPGGVLDVRDEGWRDGVPSDRGVDWGFDDITDHYVTDLFGLHRDGVPPARWLDLERAAVAHAMTRTFATWRSPESATGGAFVLSHADLRRGPGWGLIDHRGLAKAPLLALRDVLAPTALLVVDHGLDGLYLDVVLDGPEAVHADLTIEVFAAGDRPVGQAGVDITAPTRVHVERALGGFRDLTYAWRFGDRYYRALRAVLTRHDDGTILAECTHLLAPATALARPEPGIAATCHEHDGVLDVIVTATDLVEFVHVDAPGWAPTIGWFHLAPGRTRTVRCHRVGDGEGPVVVRSTSHQPVVAA